MSQSTATLCRGVRDSSLLTITLARLFEFRSGTFRGKLELKLSESDIPRQGDLALRRRLLDQGREVMHRYPSAAGREGLASPESSSRQRQVPAGMRPEASPAAG